MHIYSHSLLGMSLSNKLIDYIKRYKNHKFLYLYFDLGLVTLLLPLTLGYLLIFELHTTTTLYVPWIFSFICVMFVNFLFCLFVVGRNGSGKSNFFYGKSEKLLNRNLAQTFDISEHSKFGLGYDWCYSLKPGSNQKTVFLRKRN
jgi:hypothetical protein